LTGSTRSGFKREAKAFGFSMFGHFLHLGAAYVPPVLVLYICDRMGYLDVGLAVSLFVGLPWVFIVHYLTRGWSNWGN
jgi:hypothetical protein